MDQQIMLEAISSHLGSVATYVDWIILAAIAVAWAGLQRQRKIEALGITFDRRYAFYAVATVYLVANVAILILFLRIGDLLVQLDRENVVAGVTRLTVHEWVLNPFSFFGTSLVARLHAGEGYGLLIATWWLCNTSLSTLMDDKTNRGARVLLVLFLCTGLASMFGIQRVYSIVLFRLLEASPELSAAVSATALERMVASFVGIGVGGLIFTAANVLQTKSISRVEQNSA
jgi:hypothetical protein